LPGLGLELGMFPITRQLPVGADQASLEVDVRPRQPQPFTDPQTQIGEELGVRSSPSPMCRLVWASISNNEDAYGALACTRPLLFGPPIWDVLNAFALAAAVVFFGILGAVLGRAVRHRDSLNVGHLRSWIGSTAGLLALLMVLYGVQLVAFGLVASMFDRYLWPLAVGPPTVASRRGHLGSPA
jgi:hypothetical protein